MSVDEGSVFNVRMIWAFYIDHELVHSTPAEINTTVTYYMTAIRYSWKIERYKLQSFIKKP